MTYVKVKSSNDTKAGPSASIWAHFPISDMVANPEIGYHSFFDFLGGMSPYVGFEETNSTVLDLPDFLGGAVRITTSTTDDNTGSVYMSQHSFDLAGGTLAASPSATGQGGFVINSAAANQAMLGFEARIRLSSIANTRTSIFVGLADSAGLDATQFPVTGGDVIADESAVGFLRPSNDGADLDIVFNENGQTQVDHSTSILAGSGQNLTALVATTWVKLGFLFNPNFVQRSDGTNVDRIAFFVNGEKFGGTNIIDQVDLEAATFPDGAAMVPVISGTTDGSSAITIDIDWIRVAQMRI